VSEFKFKSDKYKKVRGGYSRLLDISCSRCGQHLCLYQKDGPGLLKRMYLDRIYESDKYSGLENRPLKLIPNLVCDGCGQTIGIPYIYEKEDRLAFRLFVGEVSKKIIKSK
jgi:ribosomal protein S27E